MDTLFTLLRGGRSLSPQRILKYFSCIDTISKENLEQMLPVTQGLGCLLERF